MKSFQFLPLFLISVLLCSCGGRSDTLIKLNQADSLITVRPDSSYFLLKSIQRSDLHSKSLKARYALLYTEAQYKNYEEFENDSLINIAVKYYEKNGERKNYGKSLMYKGAVLYDMMDYNGAILAYKMAEEVMEPLEEYLLLGLVNTRLAELYGHIYSPDSLVISRDKRALSFFAKTDDISRINRAYCTIGSSYIFTKEIDSALYYLNNSISLSREILDTTILLADCGFLTQLFIMNHDYQKAKDIATMVINRYKGINSNIIHNLSVSYARLGQIDSAYFYYNKVKRNNRNNIKDYITLSEIKECEGSFKEALYLNKEMRLFADSIYNERNRQNVLLIEKRFDYQKVALQNQIIKNRSENQIIIIAFSICILLCLIGVIIVITKHNRLVLSNKLSFIEQLKNESNIAQNKFINELSQKNETEAKLKVILEDKLTILRQLAGISYQYNSGRTNNSRDVLLREYNKIIKVGKLGDGVFKDIRDIVNIQCSGIIEHIRNEYPELNEEDLYFFSLLCCGFTPLSICAFYGYKSVEVAYVRKSRLSRKMNLQKPIEDFIKDTIENLKKP